MKKIYGEYDDKFRLPEEEKTFLWGMLRKRFGPHKATKFIEDIEFWSRGEWFKIKRTEKAHRERIKAMLETFEQAKTYLEQLIGNEQNGIDPFFAIYPPAFRSVLELVSFKGIPYSRDPRVRNINRISKETAEHVLPSMKILIKSLQDSLRFQPSKPGAPKQNLRLFVKIIAHRYQKIFGEKPESCGFF